MVFADIYKWKDEQGTIHFSDSPISVPENAEKIVEDKKTIKPNIIVTKPPTFTPTPMFTRPISPKSEPKPYGSQSRTNSKTVKTQQVKQTPITIFELFFAILVIGGIIALIKTLILNKSDKTKISKRRKIYSSKNTYKDTYKPNNQDTIDNNSRSTKKNNSYKTSPIDNYPLSKKSLNRTTLTQSYDNIGPLLTKPEQTFLKILEAVLQDKYLISHQVAINRLIKTNTHNFNNPMWQRSIDFIVCNKKDCSVILAVELDDSTHNCNNRKKRDKDVDKALSEAGIKILHIKKDDYYDPKELKQILVKNYPEEFTDLNFLQG